MTNHVEPLEIPAAASSDGQRPPLRRVGPPNARCEQAEKEVRDRDMSRECVRGEGGGDEPAAGRRSHVRNRGAVRACRARHDRPDVRRATPSAALRPRVRDEEPAVRALHVRGQTPDMALKDRGNSVRSITGAIPCSAAGDKLQALGMSRDHTCGSAPRTCGRGSRGASGALRLLQVLSCSSTRAYEMKSRQCGHLNPW